MKKVDRLDLIKVSPLNGVSQKDEGKSIFDKMSRGSLISFSLQYGPEKKVDEYKYEIDPPVAAQSGSLRLGVGESMSDEYISWKSSLRDSGGDVEKNFQTQLPSFMKARQQQYLGLLKVVASKFPTSARVILLRMQDLPEEVFQPARFGTLIIIWNPKNDEQFLTMSERAVGVPVVLGALLEWLKKNFVLDSYSYVRDARTISQGGDQHLDFDLVSRKMFKRAIIH
eukprot:TRINITY_DN10716_c0_g1_i1.p1 TRINITY_DN10716_c0_g1~~TRINITY_DN10716_c0_g1_i1.p1  ORF type:complete len:257 (+),score=84.40 TRINITY_DN10716_c0_g1_i1:94-771(+)